MKAIKEKLKNIPIQPGCYLFKDKKDKILYVGKAGVLRSRVRSYFQSGSFHPKIDALVKRITDIEYIVTDSEVEALILENNLIKKHRPRYNVNLKDDKTYPYIRITNEDFPQVFVTRKVVRDGSNYFGPYTDVKNVRYTLKTLQQIFTIRSCKHNLSPEVIKKKKIQLCLDYYIHKCKGPCQALQSKEEYNQEIDRIYRFLRGRTDDLVKEIRNEMAACSDRMEFEEAARYRDKLEALENYRNSQKVVYHDFIDRDILAVAKDDDDACAALFKVRESKITGRIHFYMAQVEWKTLPEIIEAFIEQYYFKSDEIPQEIFIQEKIGNEKPIEIWLSERLDKKVNILVPQQGEKKKLVDLAQKNAKYLLEELKLQKLKTKDYVPHVVKALQRDLRLKTEPRHIECFDISNIQGTDPVASMVCFVNGKPKKSKYRRFKIQSKNTPDDFAMMKEVLHRRYSRILREIKQMPDLIVVDGGKGQLSTAVGVLNELQIKDQSIIGLAKRLEEVFFPGVSDAQMLPHTSSSLRLLQQIRDEAHRFAITFHRERRKKRTITSELDKIEGVGPQRRRQLLKKFGSIKNIKTLTVDDLVGKGKLPKNIARSIYHYFQNRK